MESWETPRLEEQMKSEFIEDQKEEARKASKKKGKNGFTGTKG